MRLMPSCASMLSRTDAPTRPVAPVSMRCIVFRVLLVMDEMSTCAAHSPLYTPMALSSICVNASISQHEQRPVASKRHAFVLSPCSQLCSPPYLVRPPSRHSLAGTGDSGSAEDECHVAA